MSAAIFFAFVTGFLATVTGAVLAGLSAWSYDRRRSTESALKQVQALKVSNPESRFEDYLPIIGRLPASKYTKELHERLFGFREPRRVVVEVPVTDDPFAHVRVEGETVYGTVETGGVFLTPREREVLRLVADGYRNQQIARTLSLNERDVTKIVRDLLARLSARPT